MKINQLVGWQAQKQYLLKALTLLSKRVLWFILKNYALTYFLVLAWNNSVALDYGLKPLTWRTAFTFVVIWFFSIDYIASILGDIRAYTREMWVDMIYIKAYTQLTASNTLQKPEDSKTDTNEQPVDKTVNV